MTGNEVFLTGSMPLLPECLLDVPWNKDPILGQAKQTLFTAQHASEAAGDAPKGRTDGHRDRDQDQRIIEVGG